MDKIHHWITLGDIRVTLHKKSKTGVILGSPILTDSRDNDLCTVPVFMNHIGY